MNKTKPTLAQQIYEKVCVLETMLKAHLDGKPPAPSTDKQPFLATAALGEALAVIWLADAPDHLPCFDEADLLYGIPGLPILMSYCPSQVMDIGEDSYLVGPGSFSASTGTGTRCPLQWMTCTSWPSSWTSTASWW